MSLLRLIHVVNRVIISHMLHFISFNSLISRTSKHIIIFRELYSRY